MQLKKVSVKNFRLLRDVTLSLEDRATVIVGRNNSGKTSLTELIRRLLGDSSPKFFLEDFSLAVHEGFWNSFMLHTQGAEEDKIRASLPIIEAILCIAYDAAEDLGVLSDFIIDLDVNCKEALALVRYQLKAGKIEALFENIVYLPEEDIDRQKKSFYRLMKDRVPQFYGVTLNAVDPMDNTNQRELDMSSLRGLLQVGFINAQRGLDDVTHKEKDVLGKVLERLLMTAATETASTDDRDIAKELDVVVNDIQNKIDSDFSKAVTRLMPGLKLFGYPGLSDPQLHTETTLDVQRLLESHTKIRYEGANGIGLPESYNGLGSRNLIYILFQLFEFFKAFQAKQTSPGVHLVFIEEPEAHLHPQMQEVFIRQISEIANVFAKDLNGGQPWPVQFVVTTHSTHMANEAPFESIRYFLSRRDEDSHTVIKDLRDGFTGKSVKKDKEFLHKYLTLTRCDLFFADKAVLIEGSTERLLMPKMIEKVDAENPAAKLASQYVSVVEVGGAYAHHFYRFLDFLELRTLIITDLDSVKEESRNGKTVYPACCVAESTRTSNASIKKWYRNSKISPACLIGKNEEEKVKNFRRIAYQIPESNSRACGRSFEDAFMLANQNMFEICGETDVDKANDALEKAKSLGKTNFALEHAIDKTSWVVPQYIKEGLQWLANNSTESIKKDYLVITEEEPVLQEVG